MTLYESQNPAYAEFFSKRRLSCDAVGSKPRDFDFSEGWCDTWETVEPDCTDLEQVRGWAEDYGVDVDEDWSPERITEAIRDCDPDWLAPMMNYYYPVRLDDPSDAQAKLVPSCLTVVHFTEADEYGLALQSGGMDCSWEICQGFIALDFLPPLHFCDLPNMAGRGKSKSDRAIMAACLQSALIAEGWANSTAQRLAERLGQEVAS